MAPKTTTYDSESDDEYSYGWEDFRMQVDILDHTPTRSFAKDNNPFPSKETMPQKPPQEDKHRALIQDEEIKEVERCSYITLLSSVESTGQKRMPEWSPLSSPSVKRKVELTAHPRNLPKVEKSRKRGPPEFGVQLNLVHIAHSQTVQTVFDRLQLAWGTVYELARGVTRGMWTFEDMTEHRLSKLGGSNAEAAWKVAAVMKDKAPSATRAPSELWLEYDREQLAIVENKGRGLGTMGEWKGKDNWYGGKIQQVARIVKAGKTFKFELEKPEIRRSHRFARFLGSRRILQVRVPDSLMYDKAGAGVRDFLTSSKFALCGRIYVPFHAKEGSLYLFESNENLDRETSANEGDCYRLTLHDFVQWHNPLRLNSKQPISKWSTRWALGLSTSVPTIEFSPENILFIHDQNAPGWGEGKPPAEKIMTDGCGFISGAALTAIMRVMRYPTRPTAVQGRIAGAKGMWVLHPNPEHQVIDEPPRIWIRDSQNKIKLGSLHNVHTAHRIFDLLAPSRVTGPSRLSSQTLVNLAHNGVSTDLLKELMADGLHEEVRQLTEWGGTDSMLVVWRAVERAGRVVMCRLRRRIAGQARALGLGQLRPNDEIGEEMNDADDVATLSPRGRNAYSGQPFTVHETVLELLQAGFHPLKLDRLFRGLESVVTLVLDEYVEQFHIPIKESLEAYIIPDPYGVLEEGQIHFQSSERITDPESGTQMDIVIGPVLVWRNPTRLPSDIQKVTAVSHPKLVGYFDVIVFPVKGDRSLASYLGGGDYDGDTVTLVWSKRLVETFHTAPLCEAPSSISNDFEREVEHIVDFDQRVSKLSARDAQIAFQKVLLLGLAETKVGLYSNFHDLAVYERGYASSTAIRLAYMFTTCLDASKTGLRVKSHVFEADRKHSMKPKPHYMAALEKTNSRKEDRGVSKRKGPPFILDVLVDEGHRLRDELLKEYSMMHDREEHDADIISPYRSASHRAMEAARVGVQGLQSSLTVMRQHVQKAHDDWKGAIAMPKSASKVKGVPDPREQRIQGAQQFFAQRPLFTDLLLLSEGELRTVMASYAYYLSPSFAFSVAFSELCGIKARAQLEGAASFANRFAEFMSIQSNILRALSQAQDDVDDV